MMAEMGQFSIKQMLVSFTLITVSLWMSIQFERARENILFWVGVGPTLGGAVYNLNGRPIRGTVIGFICVLIAALLLALRG